jgi:hypothetical protein
VFKVVKKIFSGELEDDVRSLEGDIIKLADLYPNKHWISGWLQDRAPKSKHGGKRRKDLSRG